MRPSTYMGAAIVAVVVALAAALGASLAHARQPSLLFTVAGVESPRVAWDLNRSDRIGNPRVASDQDVWSELLAAMPDGGLAVLSDRENDAFLIRISRAGQVVASARVSGPANIDLDTGNSDVGGLAAARDGRLLAAFSPTYPPTDPPGELVRMDSDGSTHRLFPGMASQTSIQPVDIAEAEDRSVLLAEPRLARIRRVTPDGRLVAVAGTGRPGRPIDGAPAAASTVMSPYAVAALPGGGVVFADGRRPNETENGAVWRVSSDGMLRRLIGGGAVGLADQRCPGRAVRGRDVALRNLRDVTVDRDGAVIVSDAYAGVFQLGDDGMLRALVCGNPTFARRPDGRDLYTDGRSDAWPRLWGPDQLAVTPHNALLVTCCQESRIVLIQRPGTAGPVGVTFTPGTLRLARAGRARIMLTQPARVTLTVARRNVKDAAEPREHVVGSRRFYLRTGATTVALPTILGDGSYDLHVIARATTGGVASDRMLVLGRRRLTLPLARQVLDWWSRNNLDHSEGSAAWDIFDCRQSSRTIVSCNYDAWDTIDGTRASGTHWRARLSVRHSGILLVRFRQREGSRRTYPPEPIEP